MTTSSEQCHRHSEPHCLSNCHLIKQLRLSKRLISFLRKVFKCQQQREHPLKGTIAT